MAHARSSGSEFRPYISAGPGSGRVHAQGGPARRLLRHPLRRGDGLPGAARRPDRLRVGADRGPVDRGLQEDRQVDDPREQHRADDRLRRRVGRRGRRLHDARAALPVRRRGLLQVPARSRARDLRRHARRPLHDPAAARAHRQGARQAPVPRGHGLRRRAHRRREGRQPREDGLRRRRRRRSSTSSSTESSASGTRRRSGSGRRRTRRPIPTRPSTCDVTPEYLGLGYIIGPRIARELFSGGCSSWLALIPLIAIFVPDDPRRRGSARTSASPTPGWPATLLRELDLPRVHPLHRRRRGRLRRRDDAHQDAADDRLGVPRVGQVVRRRQEPRAASSGRSKDLGMGIVLIGSLVDRADPHHPAGLPARPVSAARS